MGTNTGLGIGIGIPFKNNALGGDKPYFPPELKARMIGVWTNYGKKNTDADRNIIKNKIPNAGGDLEILNAAYKLNSGFGKYSEDFTTWTKSSKITSVDSESFDFVTNVNWNLLYYKSNIGKDIPSFKVHIKLKGEGKIFYNYITSEGVFTNKVITSEEYVVPISYNTKYTGETPVNCGFTIGISNECSGTITQIPNFEDAFVTDGINDMIVSQKTLQEMGVTKGLTIVSMIHQINTNEGNFITTNNLRNADKVVGRNVVSNIDKTGIYGWYKENIEKENIGVINNILGDKADYVTNSSSSTNTNPITNSRFYVTGYAVENSFAELSSVAHYWTFAVLGKATEDEINLIIGNYNLDRSLKPDILCNIGKQGITNDNHAEFNNKLIDYSGNGRDVQMNNLAWKGGSGIAAKPFETIKDYTIVSDEARQKLTIYNEFSYKIKSNTPSYYWTVQSIIRDNTSYQVTIITDKDCYWINATSFINSEGNKESIRKKYPVLANTPTQVIICGLDQFEYPEGIEPTNAVSYVNLEYAGEITITFIPSHKGGLLLDGVNDFGKVTGMPIYKDYTFIIDYERISYASSERWVAGVVSKSHVDNQGAFILMTANTEVEPGKQAYSFGGVTSFNRDDFTRALLYQSKYKCGDVDLTVGEGVDSDTLWLGTFRGNDQRFFNGAIYSLMSFPYSMSEFLIERQLKKHKLGTLYPDMVEFRPVIKANANYKITYYQIDSTNTWKSIKVGDYIVIGAKLAFQITFDNDASELKEVVSPQLSGIIVEKKPSNPGYNIYSYITSKSPQKINITIDEYIRFEDIVQPYPLFFEFTDENGNLISWGGKAKVGNTITRFKSVSNTNILAGLYNTSNYKLNGKPLEGNNYVVEKQMVFTCTATYLFDNNEPKCILSPSRLRIPNSSYKILGYIPDISGHGNHGVIHNSAYALNSGVNGYTEDFTKWTLYIGVKCTDSTISLDSSFNKQDQWILFKPKGSNINQFTINIKGIPNGGNLYLRLSTDSNIKLENGINEISSYTNVTNSTGFFIGANGLNLDWSNLIIEQVGEYEGAYCLDGVDDFIAIPILSKGGKQVLMKVNWSTLNGFIYDQRPVSGDKTFGIYTQGDVIAYSKNNNGNTYIDGIINNNIIGSNLSKITHNIVATCDVDNSITPSIGKRSYSNSYFAQMSLYDFMLFDEISTDDKIKELNTYIGITPKVTLPNYYWDNYGKKNTDAKRSYIDEQVSLQKTGTSVNPLENFNISYEGMSGYNGYPVVFGANKTWETSNAVDYIYDINSTIVHITNVKHAANGLLYSYVKRAGALANIKEIPAFRVTIKGLEENSKLVYKYLATENATKESIVYLGNGTHKLPKSFVPTDALLDLTTNSWIGFAITPMIEGELVFDCDITIEILPEYENGLVYDGVSDFTDNKNIPIFTDFTAIIKRVDLDAKNDNSTVMFKGNKIYENSIGNGFILDYCYNSKNYVYSYGKLNQIERDDSKIIYLTPESYNGNPIIKGENEDNLGLVLGKYWKGIIYKTILYSKTISLLEINFLKNLMEKDEIIDINHPIFISNIEDESNASQDT